MRWGRTHYGRRHDDWTRQRFAECAVLFAIVGALVWMGMTG
jgi:hypothetical protein